MRGITVDSVPLGQIMGEKSTRNVRLWSWGRFVEASIYESSMNPWYWRYLKIILPKRRQISRPGPRARLHRVLLALQLLRHWLDHRTLGFRRPCCVAVMENPPSTPKNWVIYPLWPGIWTLPLIYEHLEGRYDDGNMFFFHAQLLS